MNDVATDEDGLAAVEDGPTAVEDGLAAVEDGPAADAKRGLVPVEERRIAREPYDALLARLSRQSVHKRYECFRDIDWDSPSLQITHDDPRWELGPEDPLGASSWYRGRPAAERARIGLYRVATFMKIGVQFENVLSRGLLAFLTTRADDSPEHRYAYHELIEESHHSMIFSEFIRRTGLHVPGLAGRWRRLGDAVPALGRAFPELFFVFVLGGEDPIDQAQRAALTNGRELHPLLRRIAQIHVTEEARHLCFARSFLREHVPQLTANRRRALATLAPVVLRLLAELMLRPSPHLVRELLVPPSVIATAFTRNPRHRQAVMAALAEVRTLVDELGLITPLTEPLWRRLGAES
jgi:hypothetical protein